MNIVAEKYSGGYILFCTERQVVAVIVVFLMSFQPSLLCMCVTGMWYDRTMTPVYIRDRVTTFEKPYNCQKELLGIPR